MQTLTWLHIHIMKINSLNPKVSEVKMVKETVEKTVSPLSSSKFIMLAKVLIHFAFKCRIMFFSTVKLVQGFWNASFDICHSNVFAKCSKTFHNLNSKERIIFIWTIIVGSSITVWNLQWRSGLHIHEEVHKFVRSTAWVTKLLFFKELLRDLILIMMASLSQLE